MKLNEFTFSQAICERACLKNMCQNTVFYDFLPQPSWWVKNGVSLELHCTLIYLVCFETILCSFTFQCCNIFSSGSGMLTPRNGGKNKKLKRTSYGCIGIIGEVFLNNYFPLDPHFHCFVCLVVEVPCCCLQKQRIKSVLS